jgi:hypothetical protein
MAKYIVPGIALLNETGRSGEDRSGSLKTEQDNNDFDLEISRKRDSTVR